MLRHLRRFHFLPAILFLAMPGTGGLAVQALHHCSVAAPWQAEGHGEPGAGHHAGHADHGQPDSPNESHPCTCVGQCATPSLAAGPHPAVVQLRAAEAVLGPRRFALPDEPRWGRTPHLQPPANAPPLS